MAWPTREQAEYNRRRIIEALAEDLNVSIETATRIESERFSRAIQKLFTPTRKMKKE